MKDFKSLKLLDRLKFVFKKSGVDYKVMRRILQIKLTMDERRVPTMMVNDKNNDKDKNFFLKSLLSYGIIGLTAMFIILAPFELFVKMSLCIGIIMFMLMTTMIADFSTVLLDIKDKNILMSRPIDYRTVNMAKIIHIFIYISIVASIMAGPSLIAGTIKHGLYFFIVFCFILLLSIIFIIVVTSMIYALVLNFFDGEKLKDIINYVQIMLSIVLLVGYQFVGRMFDVFDYDIVFSPRWWTYLIPPAWFAAPFSIFIENNLANHYIYLSFLSILIPIISLIIYTKLIIPYFEKNLSKLSSNNSKAYRFNHIRKKVQRIVSKIICYNKMEGIFFRFTQRMLSKERKLKLRIYPNMAFGALIPLIIIFRSMGIRGSFSEIISDISNSSSYLTMYITIFTLSSLTLMIKTSEKHEGAWIYRVLPIKAPTPIYRGAFKGFLMKYIFPVFLIPSLIFLIIYGTKLLPDLVLMWLNLILISLAIYRMSSKALPFGKSFGHMREGSIFTTILAMAFCGGLAGLHTVLKTPKYGLIVYGGAVIIGIVILWVKGTKVKWEDIV